MKTDINIILELLSRIKSAPANFSQKRYSSVKYISSMINESSASLVFRYRLPLSAESFEPMIFWFVVCHPSHYASPSAILLLLLWYEIIFPCSLSRSSHIGLKSILGWLVRSRISVVKEKRPYKLSYKLRATLLYFTTILERSETLFLLGKNSVAYPFCKAHCIFNSTIIGQSEAHVPPASLKSFFSTPI